MGGPLQPLVLRGVQYTFQRLLTILGQLGFDYALENLCKVSSVDIGDIDTIRLQDFGTEWPIRFLAVKIPQARLICDEAVIAIHIQDSREEV